MRITHDVTRPLDCSTTKYPTYVWSSPILCTKSPTPASILVATRHVTFTTYTSWDKQQCFSKPNNSIWGQFNRNAPNPNSNWTKSITHHTNKPRHKPLGFSISPSISTLTTLNSQSLNFGFKIKWSISEWPKTKDKLKKGHLVRETAKLKN
jgi:hypothetical protein